MDKLSVSVRKPRALRALFSGVALVGAMLAAPGLAHAGSGSRLALDLDYANSIKETGFEGGKGLAARYGYKLDLLVLSVTPEVGAGAYWFGGAADARLLTGFVGGRAAFGKVVEPGVFAHIGYGSMKSGNFDAVGGTTLDAGLSLDFTMVPLLDFGLHGAYGAAFLKDADEAFDWFRVGAHAALAF
ncbi:MAG: hypothetical protein QM756_20780 [Polyangiaceae bacterium]